ncbi:MAG: rhodanese-like domain-containing protein [Proteobacteria bacterium]|nr:rhodanese-like domain-containing protein [Pseudomonadota bacterium]
MKTYLIILRDALLIAATLAWIAFFINTVRPDGLPFIADKPYDIFVPCPETLGEVEMMAPTDPQIFDAQTFVVDARTQEEYDAWHLEGVICITYDYLDPIPPEELKNIIMNIAQSGKARLVVYGDGDGGQGTTGYELGREIAGNGIKNVYVVEGGANALKGGK